MNDTTADIQDGPLRRLNLFDGLSYLLGFCPFVRTIARQFHGRGIDKRRSFRGHIFWNIDNDRTGATSASHVEGFFHNFRQLASLTNQVVVFRAGPRDANCTSSDQLLNFFTLVAEVEVQHESANFAFSIAPC